jgi:hypothetical protein
MDTREAQEYVASIANTAAEQFQKLPGSAIFLRYVQSSYQNDPIRSAVELFLVLFAIRYLLAPKYSTKQNYVKLSEEVGSRYMCHTAFRGSDCRPGNRRPNRRMDTGATGREDHGV